MLFGVSGASGTGKSTLCYHVAQALGIKYVKTSVTDMARKAGYNAVGELNIEERITLQKHLLIQFCNMIDGISGHAILDRTPIDLIGYMLPEIGMHTQISDKAKVELDKYVTDCQRLASGRFRHIFITGILPEYEIIGTRPSWNPAYQRNVHLLISGSAITAAPELSFSIISETGLDSRVAHTQTVVSRMLREQAEKNRALN